MDSLIQISKNTINGVEINSVNARELYNNLGLAKGQYSRWIQNNLIDQFLYNDDYIGVRQVVEGNEVVSHIVTLDTAKHLCMMAKTENAMKFRKYFIEFEKQGKSLINQQSQEIRLLQGMLNTISKMDNRVTELEQTRRLENWQEKQLQDSKNFKVYEILKSHNFENDKEMENICNKRIDPNQNLRNC